MHITAILRGLLQSEIKGCYHGSHTTVTIYCTSVFIIKIPLCEHNVIHHNNMT